MGRTAGLIVAADQGSGFPAGIALGSWGSSTVIERLVGVAADAGLDPIVVVLGANAEDVIDRTDLSRAVVIIDPEWEEGPAASIRAGLDLLSREDDVDAAALISVTEPQLPTAVLEAVVSEQAERESMAVAPKYRYAEGPPYVVHRTLWQRLMGMEGNARVESLLKAHPEWVDEVWVDQLPPTTIETEDDLAALAPRT